MSSLHSPSFPAGHLVADGRRQPVADDLLSGNATGMDESPNDPPDLYAQCVRLLNNHAPRHAMARLHG